MPQFRVVYSQRETRSFWIESPDAEAAIALAKRMVEEGTEAIDADSFESAADAEIDTIATEGGTVIYDGWEEPV